MEVGELKLKQGSYNKVDLINFHAREKKNEKTFV